MYCVAPINVNDEVKRLSRAGDSGDADCKSMSAKVFQVGLGDVRVKEAEVKRMVKMAVDGGRVLRFSGTP